LPFKRGQGWRYRAFGESIVNCPNDMVVLAIVVVAIPLSPALVDIVWGYVRTNWWQCGLRGELLEFIETANAMPELEELVEQ
jgi:hypothetical protein